MTLIVQKSGNAKPGKFRWTRALYDQAVVLGLFEGLHIELIGGEIVNKYSAGTPFRWERALYDKATSTGLFDGLRIELIAGEFIQMSPIHFPHAQSCTLTADLLKAAFGQKFFVNVQLPLAIGDSEPQPDLAVIAGSPRDYVEHPTTGSLVVEVADTSLASDLGDKVSLYASAGIPEYWVLDINNRQLIVFLNPKPAPNDPRALFGHLYTHIQTLAADQSISPLGAPAASLKIADMLP